MDIDKTLSIFGAVDVDKSGTKQDDSMLIEVNKSAFNSKTNFNKGKKDDEVD